MKTKITLWSLAIITVFSSCSRETHYFSKSTGSFGSYEKTKQIATTEANDQTLENTTLTASAETQPVIISQTPSISTAKAPKAEAKVIIAEQVLEKTPVMTKKEVKATVKAAKKEAKEAKDAKAEGKSQVVAALLAFLLGAIGIHRFYLGYTEKGILFIAMVLVGALTLTIIIGALIFLALYVWISIDFVRILTGRLKPKGGEYGKTI
jgi:TM2 domain-containing membrane protein YozV